MGDKYNFEKMLKPKYLDGVPFTFKTRDIDMYVLEKLKTLEFRTSDVLVAGLRRSGKPLVFTIQ